MGMFDNIRFPYFNLQQLNLDWLLNEVKRIAGFMPQDGNVGDILTRKSDGAAWEQPAAVQVDINGLPGDTQIMDNDELIFYDVSAQANRKIKPPDLMDSMASNAYPSMDGTASAGTSKKPARYDHVHPTDTSRAKASYFSSDKLKIANGGTNASNPADARTNLGLGAVATEDVVPVAKGGTGGTDAATARSGIGAMDAAFTPIALGDINTAKTITLNNISFAGAILVIDGISVARQGMYIIGFRRTNVCVYETVAASTDVTITAGTGTITVSSSEANTLAYLLPLQATLADNIAIT